MRTALLAVMCVETVLPMVGNIKITLDQTSWTITAKHDRLTLDPDLWVPLSKGAYPRDLSAAKVHFGLLPEMEDEAERTLTHGVDWAAIGF